jgi:hypothetical protein
VVLLPDLELVLLPGWLRQALSMMVMSMLSWVSSLIILLIIAKPIGMQTTGGDYEMLAGNLASISVGGIIAMVSSYMVCCTKKVNAKS